jgi:O-antigen/teichoic acid export membrane protein
MSVETAARAGAWSALDIVLRQGLQFGVSVVLARLLTPADFGLIALLTFFTSLSVTFVQGGLSMALVQRQGTTLEEETAVFWCNLGASVILGLLFIVIAPFVARFYEEPLLQPLMFVASAQVVLSALAAVQTALLTRALRFDQLTKTGIFSSVLSGAIGVGTALWGWGVWALAAQLLSASAATALALWWVSDWRPAVRVRLAAVRSLVGFGVHISLSSVLEVIYSNGFLLVIGKLYSVRDLGIWNRAVGVTALPTNVVSQIIGRTALPLFASRTSDPEALRRGLRMALGLAMLISLPLMVGLCVLADSVILALFGEKWRDAAPLVAVTALSGMLVPLQALNLSLLLAIGDSGRYLRIEIWKKVYGIGIVGVGCFFGMIGIAWAALVTSIIAYLLNAKPAKDLIGYGAARQVTDLGGVIFCAALMGAAVFGLKQYLALSPWPALAILTPAGAIVYCAAGFLLRISHFQEAFQLAKRMILKFLTRSRPDQGTA